MSVFDTSVTTTATLPTWFSDAQKAISTTGKTVYDAATPFSSTAGASMSRDLFGTPSQTSMMPPNAVSEPAWTQQPDGTYAPSFSDGPASMPIQGGSGSDTPFQPGISDPNMPQPTGGGLPTSSNPFMTAMQTLQGVATGAANPFLANGDPNKQTALGGLFAAQNAKLDQILPGLTSEVGAGGIGGGNFGSLRGQTAVNTARAGALTTLAEQQNKAALDAQNYAIQAARGVGDVGSQYSTAALNTTDREMNAGLNQLAKYSDIINAMGPTMDKTTNVVTKGSSYENLLKGLDVIGTSGDALNKILKGKSGYDWLDKITNPTGGNDADSIYGGDTSNPGHWEGGEWIED